MNSVDYDEDISFWRQMSCRKLLGFIGPGFLVCIAYIDPGNVITDLQAGHDHGYSLLWVMIASTIGGLFIQCLSAKLGIVARRHLAEQCSYEYRGWVKVMLFIGAEIAVIGADMPEVVGSAYALHFLTLKRLPVWIGIIIVFFMVLEFPLFQLIGTGKVELVVSAMVSIISACYIIELFVAKPNWEDAAVGSFFPLISDPVALLDATGLVGAVVMPHNLFLHSCLVQEKALEDDRPSTKVIAAKYNYLESSLALGVSLLINLALIMISATKFAAQEPTMLTAATIFSDINAKIGIIMFAVGLFCAGQSATITGTYAQQIIIKGFLNKDLPLWVSNISLRVLTVPPALILAIIMRNDERQANTVLSALIFWSQVILSFVLPFAMIPLIRFTNNVRLMGKKAVNGPLTKMAAYFCTFIVLVANVFTTVFQVLQQVPSTSGIALKVIVYALSAVLVLMYVAVSIWLLWRPTQQGLLDGNLQEYDSLTKVQDDEDAFD